MPSNRDSTRHDLMSLSDSFLLMGTVVTIRIVGQAGVHKMRESIDQAIAAMRAVEAACSRFDDESALRELCRHPGENVAVPPALYHALRIAREVAEMTDGVFDPSIGRMLEQQGFNRNYLTGQEVTSDIPWDDAASFRDITIFEDGKTIRLEKPMLLDLGAVAKGLAVDLAAQEIHGYEGFAVDAGGDIYVSGVDPSGDLWRVGIEDPVHVDRLLGSVQVKDMAVCTSGSYKRRSPKNSEVHHLLNPTSGEPVDGLLSCTVVGPQAALADVAATAAFLLGPQKAIPFIESLGLAGLCVATDHQVQETSSMGVYKR
ncbi:FAD:protein FMN transferase [Sulfobacillus harzensis]|uniref:FAD:protein FMN transferase n=1 Tax=Sulfobacillus harzensis TaxID=2729629 RepID=A0A7Y0Q1H4_9FIRM|nr:FAD:protein FMN transferase [Sulfobacillus harzensis]NMP22098.1 FAD:protein FMN transferase [Sulfobacillus harzensis]